MSLTPIKQQPLTKVRKPGQLIIPNRPKGAEPEPGGGQ